MAREYFCEEILIPKAKLTWQSYQLMRLRRFALKKYSWHEYFLLYKRNNPLFIKYKLKVQLYFINHMKKISIIFTLLISLHVFFAIFLSEY